MVMLCWVCVFVMCGFLGEYGGYDVFSFGLMSVYMRLISRLVMM